MTSSNETAMRQRILDAWNRLLSSLWFVPGIIVLGAVLLAFVLVEETSSIDREALQRFPRIFGAGADGSRAMLSAIASSMITVAGVTFSITIVAVSQASTQYTPRILRNFMRDTANQVALGAFVGIFAYCLVVLRTIRSATEQVFIPSIAVVTGVVLALVGIGVLIFFIHHIATTLQASSVIKRVADDTLGTVEDMLVPGGPGADEGEVSVADLAGRSWVAVPAAETGYVDGADLQGLLELARNWKTTVRMERGVGEFVVAGQPLVSLTTEDGSGRPRQQRVEALNDLYLINAHRTVQQDVSFGVRQLVDIALKALSPSVNDPTTAVMCIDYIESILVRLANHPFGDGALYGGDGTVRVLLRRTTFPDLVQLAFDEIRQNAESNPRVLIRLLHAIGLVIANTQDPLRHEALVRECLEIRAGAQRGIPGDSDRSSVDAMVDHALAAAAAHPAGLRATSAGRTGTD